MNYCYQRKEKYLSIFITKDVIIQMNFLKKIDYGDLKFIANNSGLETDFSQLKDPVAFLDTITTREISIEEAGYKEI